MVECKTWRHWGHFLGDSATYRDPAEHEAWLKRDPLILCADLLLSEGWATESDFDKIKAEADAEMKEALEFGRSSPFPGKEELYADVYTD